MNLQQLQYFKAISETSNFTIAAQVMSVTQPALSKAISKLETELGVSLLERNGRNVSLTTYGSAFLKHAELALSEIEKGMLELQHLKDINKDIIAVTSTYCIGTYFMPFIISGFLSENPDAKFQFNHQLTREIIEDLISGKIDIGFYDDISELNTNSTVESAAIKKEDYVLIVPKSHSLANEIEVSLKDLKNESFIVYCSDSKDKLLSYSEFLGDNRKISVQPNQANMLCGLVAAGAGITIVPNTPLINTNCLSIIKIKEDIGYRTIYMGWLSNSPMSPMTKNFRDYVLSKTST